MHLPNNEYKFYFKEKGEVSGQWFEGDFTVKCVLNIEEQVQVGILVDRYNGGSRTIDPSRSLMNRTIAELEVRLSYDKNDKPLCPTWWEDSVFGRKLIDHNILYGVFAKAMEGEANWKKALNKEGDKAEKEVKKSEKVKAERESQDSQAQG